MNGTKARRILRTQEAKERILERALHELDLELRDIVNPHRENRGRAIQAIRELLQERYAEALAAIPHLTNEGERSNPDFSIAREIVRRLERRDSDGNR